MNLRKKIIKNILNSKNINYKKIKLTFFRKILITKN